MSDDVQHIPHQIGARDREGWRTFQTPGDVCLGCSDPEAGRWVAVSECGPALAIFALNELEFLRQQEETLEKLWPRDANPGA